MEESSTFKGFCWRSLREGTPALGKPDFLFFWTPSGGLLARLLALGRRRLSSRRIERHLNDKWPQSIKHSALLIRE